MVKLRGSGTRIVRIPGPEADNWMLVLDFIKVLLEDGMSSDPLAILHFPDLIQRNSLAFEEILRDTVTNHLWKRGGGGTASATTFGQLPAINHPCGMGAFSGNGFSPGGHKFRTRLSIVSPTASGCRHYRA